MDILDSCLNSEPTLPEKNKESNGDVLASVEQIVDIFASSVSLERTHIEEGYADGYKDGLTLGKQDGYQVGLKHGFQVGEELGFYRGLVDVWTSAIRVDPSCFSTRVQKIIQQMSELLDEYPIMEPEDERVDEIMGTLRLKFRVVCATLGVKLEYNGYPKKSDAQEIDF
ncbi:hypothetical protein Nepgr_000454 [Nepenthes gracilis]|uniref:Essential protein Yae1 N-terminal domain-containing protein n=1 Tax=Nepenthes gracilis TaxID=150966 RepID=A0AAD3P4I0_NEPGR|nr:hypothetical protein Nepgr_000454 [Nepenthes gracilis]